MSRPETSEQSDSTSSLSPSVMVAKAPPLRELIKTEQLELRRRTCLGGGGACVFGAAEETEVAEVAEEAELLRRLMFSCTRLEKEGIWLGSDDGPLNSTSSKLERKGSDPLAAAVECLEIWRAGLPIVSMTSPTERLRSRFLARGGEGIVEGADGEVEGGGGRDEEVAEEGIEVGFLGFVGFV